MRGRLDSTGMATSDDFDLTIEKLPLDTAVVRIVGELDLAAAPRLQEAFSDAQTATQIVIDLSGCTFIDSSGVRVLADLGRDLSARGGRVDLVATNPSVLRVLEITGIDTVIPVHPALDSAL